MNYLIWLTIFIWIPTAILWLFNFNLLWRHRKILLYAMIGALFISVPWDIVAISNRIWYFPKEGVMGIYFGIVPLEEYLYMATVTLLIATITLLLKYRKEKAG